MSTFFTVFALAKYQNKYLIIQRANNRDDGGSWNCITGYIQERESAEEGALRELKEETNLEGRIVKTSKPFWADEDGKRWVVVASLIEVDDISNLKFDENEIQAHKWIEKGDSLISSFQAINDVFKELQQ